MAKTMEQLFEEIAAARGTGPGSGEFFRSGKYKLTVKQAKFHAGFRGQSVLLFFRVDSAVKTQSDVDPNSVGSTTKLILKVGDEGKQGVMAQINLNAFLRALTGAESASDAELKATLRDVFHPEKQPARGMAVHAEAYPHTTDSGKEITVVTFSHDPMAGDVAEVTKRRKTLDSEG